MVDIPVTALGAMLMSFKADHPNLCGCGYANVISLTGARGIYANDLTKDGPWIQEAEDWVKYNIWYDLD